MQVERLQGLLQLRQGFSNEGKAFSPETRHDVIAVLKESMEGCLPSDELGRNAMHTLLRLSIEVDALSRPAACATFLMEYPFDEILETTERSFNDGRYDIFIPFHDGALGFSQAFARIAKAEDFLIDVSNSSFDRTLDTIPQELSLPLSEQVDIFLEIQREGQHCAGLLAKDPSGVGLLEDFVERLKNPDSSSIRALLGFSEVPEFVIAGAEVALDCYRKLFPLSE